MCDFLNLRNDLGEEGRPEGAGLMRWLVSNVGMGESWRCCDFLLVHRPILSGLAQDIIKVGLNFHLGHDDGGWWGLAIADVWRASVWVVNTPSRSHSENQFEQFALVCRKNPHCGTGLRTLNFAT